MIILKLLLASILKWLLLHSYLNGNSGIKTHVKSEENSNSETSVNRTEFLMQGDNIILDLFSFSLKTKKRFN